MVKCSELDSRWRVASGSFRSIFHLMPAAEEDPPPPKSEPKPAPAKEAAPGDPKPVNELTPEEQMERFEKELKETDWGHQPC